MNNKIINSLNIKIKLWKEKGKNRIKELSEIIIITS